MEMDINDMKMPILPRRKRQSQRRLFLNSMALSVIVSLCIHLLVLFMLEHMEITSVIGGKNGQKNRDTEETDWIFDIPMDLQKTVSSGQAQGHARKSWQLKNVQETLPREEIQVKGAEAASQIPVKPTVESKDLQVSPEELDKAFKKIRLTGVELEGKTPEVPKIESATLPKMADMLPDTSLMLDIPDVPDAMLNTPAIKDTGIEAPAVSDMKRTVAVKPVALPENIGDAWTIAYDKNAGAGDALKTTLESDGVMFGSLDGLGKLNGGGAGGTARQRAVTYGVKIHLGDGIRFGTPGNDDDQSGDEAFQPQIVGDDTLLQDVRTKEGGEAIESSLPLDGFVDVQVKIMRDDNGGGYFQVLIRPNETSAELNDVAKDVLFILDRSGSIRQGRLRQFRRATLEALSYLNPGDRFNVVTFSSSAESLFETFVPVNAENMERTQRHLNWLISTGTTDVFGGIGPFVKRSNGDKTRPVIVFMMTDGQSTIAVHKGDVEVDNRKSNAVLKAIATANPGNVSIYPFSAGKDTNRMLMDFMARLNGGMPRHVAQGDGFSGELGEYMRMHTSLIVRNFRYIAEGRLAADIFPKTLPHLYRKESLAIYGKFSPADEELVLTLLGYDAQGKLRNLVFKRKFAECEEVEQDALEQGAVSLREQWTAQKTLHLLAQWVVDYDSEKANGAEQKRRRQELNRLLGTITAFSKYSELLQ